MGYFFSVIAKTQLLASQISLIATFLPSFMLSGFMYPIDQMPLVIQAVTHIVPASYYMSIHRNIFLKGTSVALMWKEFAALAAFALILAAVATRVFKKRLD